MEQLAQIYLGLRFIEVVFGTGDSKLIVCSFSDTESLLSVPSSALKVYSLFTLLTFLLLTALKHSTIDTK